MSGLNMLFSDNQRQAMKKLEVFKERIKNKIENKDEKLKYMLDVNGENPKKLHELIEYSNAIDKFDYWIDTMYEIPEYIKIKIKEIYDSVFE